MAFTMASEVYCPVESPITKVSGPTPAPRLLRVSNKTGKHPQEVLYGQYIIGPENEALRKGFIFWILRPGIEGVIRVDRHRFGNDFSSEPTRTGRRDGSVPVD